MTLLIGRPAPDMTKPLIFLDIDGVLNTSCVFDRRERFINPENMNALNLLLDETGANLVISSAWRYLITDKLMTLEGFHHMLTTHGLAYERHVIGKTEHDGGEFGNDRADQIWGWIHKNYPQIWSAWIALDDTKMPSMPAHHVVYTLPHQGLRVSHVQEAIAKISAQCLTK